MALVPICAQMQDFECASALIRQLPTDLERAEAFKMLARVSAHKRGYDYMHEYFTSNALSSVFFRAFLPAYQLECTRSARFRQSCLYSPFDEGLAMSTVLLFLRRLLQQGNRDAVQAILAQSPSLDLEVLLDIA